MGTKIKLEVDTLQVESFEAVGEEHGQRGTVRGNMSLGCDTQYDGTCNNYGTCHPWGACLPIP
jgi:hypothetical protein